VRDTVTTVGTVGGVMPATTAAVTVGGRRGSAVAFGFSEEWKKKKKNMGSDSPRKDWGVGDAEPSARTNSQVDCDYEIMISCRKDKQEREGQMKQKIKEQGLRIQQLKKALQKRQKVQLGYKAMTESLRKQLVDVKQKSASGIIAHREDVATLKRKNRVACLFAYLNNAVE